MTARGETGVDHAELIGVFRAYAKLVGEASPKGPSLTAIGDDLEGLCDTLEILHDGGRDVLTAAEHREELGMCRDGDDHWFAECGPYECPTWREYVAEDAAEERRERGW